MAKVTNAQLKELILSNATTTNNNFKAAKTEINGKVDKVEGKGLSTNDFTDALEAKLNALPTAAELAAGYVAKEAGKGLSSNDFTTALKGKLEALPTNAELEAGYVAKEAGKGLSTNDYTTAEKEKLAALPTNADLQSAIDAKTTMAAVEAKGYQTASDVATAIANAEHLKREIVQVLPAVADADANTIYMVLKSPAGDSGNIYNEYFLINGAFELIGDSKVDLTGYATESYVNGQGFLKAADIAGKQDTIDASHKLSADLVDDTAATNKFVTAAEKAKIAEVDNKVEAQDVTDAINEIFGSMSITAWANIDINS